MNKTSLLFGVLPLVIFVIIDSFFGLEEGVISALVFAFFEVAYSYYKFRKIDALTWGSLFFVGLFGLLSLYTADPLFFKLQPVFLGSIFCGVLFISQFVGQPLLVLMSKKYHHIFPPAVGRKMNHPFIVEKLKKLNLYLGFGLLLHSLAVAYAAFYLSEWWWLGIRGVGLYVVMGACVLILNLTYRV